MKPLLLAAACLLMGQAPASRAEEADDTQDVLCLGSGMPTVIRLRVRDGGKRVGARWEEFMAKLFAFLDANRSGGLDRLEASRAPSAGQLGQVFGGNALASRGTRGALGSGPPFPRMDADRDGKVTLEEMKAYYAANGCGPLLVNAPDIRQAAGKADPASDSLFRLLDTDKDGKLSKAELLAAERVLMRHDADEDELVSPGELGLGAGRGGLRGDVMIRVPRQDAKLPALLLLPREEGARRRTACVKLARGLLAGLNKKKQPKATLAESGLAEEAFARIDRNRDGKIDALEMARVMAAAPAGEFGVRLGGGTSRWGKGPLSLRMGGTRLTVVAGLAQAGYGESGLEDYVLGFVRAGDKGKRGFVTRAQITGEGRFVLTSLFEQADRNGDGRLTLDEARQYVRTMDAGRGVQLALTLSGSGQGLFQALDANRDGALSVRELRTAWARLQDMDADGDGAIAPEEFPLQATLLVGNAPQARFGQEGVRQAPDRGPAWFRKMDRNGDGDVSRAEWLGDPAEFERIDADKDGLIGLEEAEAHDARSRKK